MVHKIEMKYSYDEVEHCTILYRFFFLNYGLRIAEWGAVLAATMPSTLRREVPRHVLYTAGYQNTQYQCKFHRWALR
jgi:hypothetical protein